MAKSSKHKRITNSLYLVETAAQEYFAVVRKYRGAPEGSPGAEEIKAKYYHFEAELFELVHQQTLQLYHP